MTIPAIPQGAGFMTPHAGNKTGGTPNAGEGSGIGQKFEQMLWAEMLSHAGLEKAFTQSGGEAVSAFSRYIVEAIAKDLSEQHPLGFAKAAVASSTQGKVDLS